MKLQLPAWVRDLHSLWNSKQKNGEPIAADVSETPYYRERSVAYATAQMILVMVLAVFLAVSFLTGRDGLSVQNLSLLISDIGSVVIVPEHGSTETLTFVADEQNHFVSYRGGLAVLGKERMTVFTATGRENFAVGLGYETPRLATSGKYLLAYDLGRSSLSVYNAFSKLFETETTSPIRGVAVSSAGYFCVITDDKTLAGCVTLYDGDFDVISRLHLKEHTVCAAIADDGEQMCCASVSSKDGRMQLSLLFSVPGEDTVQASTVLQDAYPLSLTYTDHGLLLLCSDAVYTMDRSGAVLQEYHFDANDVKQMDLTSHGATLLLRANNYSSDTRVVAIGASGAKLYDIVLAKNVTDAAICEDECLYILNEAEFSVYTDGDATPKSTHPLRENYLKVLPLRNGEVFLCGKARAARIETK